MQHRQPVDPYNKLAKARRVAYLIAGFLKKELSIQEEEELDAWVVRSEANQELFAEMTASGKLEEYLTWYANLDTEARLRSVKARLNIYNANRRLFTLRSWQVKIAAAAGLILFISIAFLLWRKDSLQPGQVPAAQVDISPGRQFATLDMDEGQLIELTPSLDTILSRQLTVRNGALRYIKTDTVVQWHTLHVPSRAWFRFTLPDGTKAWVNASSTIRYPSRFTGSHRNVILTGEAYFEVEPDASHPFIVQCGKTFIEAVGTAFHIQSYPDEPAFTSTLLEGSIRVRQDIQSKMVYPGQQLSIRNQEWQLEKADTASVIAWTRNEFRMRKQPIHSVMRMLSRWYGAQIMYEKEIDYHFNGTISRDVPVSEVLHLLEQTGDVKFKINTDAIIVTK